jgi:dihydroxyacetone kinase
VGRGGLDAAVPGRVFASGAHRQISQTTARFGRAGYVGARAVGNADAGAVGIAVLIGPPRNCWPLSAV